MSAVNNKELEAVGKNYDAEQMLVVRDMTREAVHSIAVAVKPGMLEEDAVEIANNILAEKGMLRGWHNVYVRFGCNTIKSFGEASDPGIRLGDDDIFFIDIGPTWKSWEGDGGDTFVTGTDQEKLRCAQDAREIFHEVRRHWLDTGDNGRTLYEIARAAAKRRGWILNMDLSGHRVSDFPHAAIYGGAMAEIDFHPSAHLWVLEIHIRNVEHTYGAFFEDMLLDDSYFA